MQPADLNLPMSLTIESDFDFYFSKVSEFLYQHEAMNSLMLGIMENFKKGLTSYKELSLQSYIEGVDQDDKSLLIVGLQTPKNYLILSQTEKPSHARSMAEQLAQKNLNFPGVVGPAAAVEEFLAAWSRSTGQKTRIGMNQKIYELTQVQPPKVTGRARWAEAKDIDLIGQWTFEFARESLPPNEHRPLSERIEQAQRLIAAQNVMVWDVNGESVSMAMRSRETLNGVSVNGVFTPVDLRGHGYASAVVAAISQQNLDRGKKFCVLYTDLSNLTSNKIYQKIGYKEIGSSTQAFLES